MEEENVFSQVFLYPPHVYHSTPVEKESKEKETQGLLSVCSLLSDVLLTCSFRLSIGFFSFISSLLIMNGLTFRRH